MANTLPGLYFSICGWLDACPALSHPVVTMRYLDTPEGKIQVKWWSECRVLEMYNVELTMSEIADSCLHDSKSVEALTLLCKSLLLLDKYNIKEVKLVDTVDDPHLLDIEHMIDLKYRFLTSIVDPRDNQNMIDVVWDEILQLEKEKGRRTSIHTLLTKCGWVRVSDYDYRLRRISSML
jgi:hypothetical protein